MPRYCAVRWHGWFIPQVPADGIVRPNCHRCSSLLARILGRLETGTMVAMVALSLAFTN